MCFLFACILLVEIICLLVSLKNRDFKCICCLHLFDLFINHQITCTHVLLWHLKLLGCWYFDTLVLMCVCCFMWFVCSSLGVFVWISDKQNIIVDSADTGLISLLLLHVKLLHICKLIVKFDLVINSKWSLLDEPLARFRLHSLFFVCIWREKEIVLSFLRHSVLLHICLHLSSSATVKHVISFLKSFSKYNTSFNKKYIFRFSPVLTYGPLSFILWGKQFWSFMQILLLNKTNIH